MEDFKNKQEIILTKSRVWLVIGIVLILISPLFFFVARFMNLSYAETGTIGDTIGGITSPITGLIGAILVYYAFLIQLEANKMLFNQIKEEKTERKKNQIESHFFELLRIHIENQNNLKINDIKNQNTLQGKEVFQWMLREFYECYDIINRYFELFEQEEEVSTEEKINIAYTCLLFGGVGEYSLLFIQEQLKDHGAEFIPWIKDEFQKRKKKIQKNYPFKLFNGHHARIGHYNRHLYQTVKYINSQDDAILPYKDKYNYIKTLRAQLGTHEQTFLFFVSLTDAGIKWEKAIQLSTNKHLITKYNLIKDIPKGYITITKPESHYPDVNYNNQGNSPHKIELIKSYN